MSAQASTNDAHSNSKQAPIDFRRIEVVDAEIAEILRRKSTIQRIQMVLDANVTIRLMIAGRLRTENPSWNSTMVDREVARRMLNNDLHPGRLAAQDDHST